MPILKQQLAPVMVDLSRRMTERLRFPDDFDRWTADKRDGFKFTYRYDVADVLLCCCDVADWREVLMGMAAKLQEELGRWQAAAARASSAAAAATAPGWQGVEAAMYGIRAIARYVSDDEGSVLPPLFALLPQLPPNVEVRSTSFRLIGRYTRWLARHPDVATASMAFVVQNGLLPRPDAGREWEGGGLWGERRGWWVGGGGPQVDPQGHAPFNHHATLTRHASITCPPNLPAASDLIMASPAQESAANAIKDLANHCVRVPAVRDALLRLPRAINIVALNTDNACKVLEAVGDAIGTLPPGQHAAHVEAALQPPLAVLHAFARDPASACAAAAAGGLLASAVTHMDGAVRAVHARPLGLDESAAEALVAEARRTGGAVPWNPSSFRASKVAPALVVLQLKRVVAALRALHTHRELVPVAAGCPSSEQLYTLSREERDGACGAAGG